VPRTVLTILVWGNAIGFLWMRTEIVISLVTGVPVRETDVNRFFSSLVITLLAWELRERKFGPRCPRCGGFHGREREEVDS
jgi:hypothetical protein